MPLSRHSTQPRLWHDALFAAYFLIAFLQSVYLGPAPLSLVAAVYLGGVMFILGELDIALPSAAVAIAFASSFIIVSSDSRLPDVAILKFAVGAYLFFFTLLSLPQLAARYARSFDRAITAVLWVFCCTFFFDYLNILSFKALGIVRLWSSDGATEIQLAKDIRTSGLFSEPSWLCLSILSLLTAKWTLGRRSTILFIVCALCILLSRSATGLAGLGILGAAIIWSSIKALHFRGLSAERMLGLLLLAIGISATLALIVAIAAQNGSAADQISELTSRVLMKLYDPANSDSGAIRFLTPLPVLAEVLDNSPLFGLGASAINQTMSGKIGTAVLPFNVFIELGLFGTIVYASAVMWLVRKYQPSLSQLALCMLNLFTLGFPTSPFQSAMLGLLLFRLPKSAPKEKSRLQFQAASKAVRSTG